MHIPYELQTKKKNKFEKLMRYNVNVTRILHCNANAFQFLIISQLYSSQKLEHTSMNWISIILMDTLMSANYMRCVQFDVSVFKMCYQCSIFNHGKKKKIPKNPVMLFRDVVDKFGVNEMKIKKWKWFDDDVDLVRQ